MRRLFIILLSFFSLFINGQESFTRDYFSDLVFRNVGPSRGGRVTAVAGVESVPGLFYMGATGGGVWKTVDYGSSWTNVSDGFFETPSIGAIRVYQADPDIIYVGTGSDGIRSNVIIGRGIYKSVDAGETWTFSGLKDAGQIGAVEIDPSDPDRLFVAAIGNPFGPNPERGVYRSLDGGANWEKVLFISENTGSCDLEIHPSNPDIIYASVWTVRRKPWTIISGSEEGGVYRSVDGGDSWVKLRGGLPSGIVGKSDLAVCEQEPDNLYVLVEALKGGGLYISTDRGETFSLASSQSNLLDRPFYYTNVDVDPTNPDIIYVNTTGFFRSVDRGRTWVRRSTPHGDNHDMWINPSDPDLFIQSNDGGANVTRDGGITWSTQINQPTAELYQVDLDDQFPYWLYAGQQDNSTIAIPSNITTATRNQENYLMAVGGCETGPAVPKPGNHNIVYSNCKGRFGRYSKITGQEKQYYVGAANMYGHNPADLKYRFQRVSPIIVSPHDSRVVYHASQYLHRTTDEGVTWETISPDLTAFEPDKQVISGGPINRDITGEEFYSTIYSVAESTLRKGVIWTGANDGPVHVTVDNGLTWTNVTPADLPPGGRVQTVEASPHNPAKAYIAVYRYLLNDWEPYIYRTDDYGKTWSRLTDGINGIDNDNPVRVVRESPDTEGLLFAGTERGLYISFNDGADWLPFQFNLPVVPVTDIKIFRNDLILSTMGRSFWIMDNISPLNQLHLLDNGPGEALLQPAVSYRASWSNGAAIDYKAGSGTTGLRITVYDPEGKPVRLFLSGGDKSLSAEEKLLSAGTDLLDSEPGLHRIYWDLRSWGPLSLSGRRSNRGPSVIPGRYRIVLSTNKGEISTFLEVLPDPSIIADGISFNDYREQYDLCVKVRKLINEISEIKEGVEKNLSLLEARSENGSRLTRKENGIRDDLLAIERELNTGDGSYPQPMLNDQVLYLYSMITSTDQKPGKDAYIRYNELLNIYSRIKVKYDGIIN